MARQRQTLKPLNSFNIDKHISVLYVEDDMDIQEEFTEILSLYVDEIYTATNGHEGLEKYHIHHPNIIITDIQMPVLTGLEMIEKIRVHDHVTPIVVTSAFNDNNYLLEAIGLGVEHYLLKPIMFNPFERCIEKIKHQLMQARELKSYQTYLEDRIEEEVALREAKEALLIEQNKSSEVGQMVSIIAHQWKQPLHYLNLLIEDIGMEYEYQALSEEYIRDFIQKGTSRVKFLTDTMDNFLRFYKNEKDASTFQVSALIQEISMFLDLSLKTQGISIKTIVHGNFVLFGVRNEFQQVILNLVNNAKEAFEGQKRDDARVTIYISRQDDIGRIIIQDNAGGISKNNLESIFELEYTTKQEGTGIGLYLVRKIVEQKFQGSIKAENGEFGACFTLEFKLKKEI